MHDLALTLFTWPFLAGLLLSVLLPALGNLLRLREEWLATLALAHLAAAAGLGGLALGLPILWGAQVGALAGAACKHLMGAKGNHAYGAMMLVGWAAGLLVAANTPLGGALGHAVVDGQLYFTGLREVWANVILSLCALIALPWLTPRLIAAKLFPSREKANHLPHWRWHLGFDVLTAIAIAAATATLGLMAAFSLILLPSWLAFRLSSCWRRANWLACGFSAIAYVTAFVLAYRLDQPFGPVLASVLLVGSGAVAVLAHYWQPPKKAVQEVDMEVQSLAQ